MKNQLEKLSIKDKEMLLRAPALVSLLAASKDGIIDEQEIADAIDLSHLRTFTSPLVLQPYFEEVENIFKPELTRLIKHYSPFDENQKKELKAEIDKAYHVLGQLDNKFRKELVKSLQSYAKHVGHAHWNFLDDFIFPLGIFGDSH